MPVKPQILIRKAGPLTTIQDGGRLGYMEYGLSRSGAMDQQSALIANRLLGNEDDAPLLETTFQGLSLKFADSCVIAITGGDLGAELNGKHIDSYRAIPIKREDSLIFKKRRSGFRAYLAVLGGIESQAIMESRSSHSMFDLGHDKIRDGLALRFHIKKGKLHPQIIRESSIPVFSKHFTARILPGPEFHVFPKQLIDKLSKVSFTVSSDSNRMGYRLDGTLNKEMLPDGIVSSGIVPGTIQITSSGQPIILMSDGPTTGGYARVGNVITPDLNHIAQLAPGDTLRFKWIGFEEADQLLGNYRERLQQILI